MVKSEVSLVTKRDKIWLYDEYYSGDKDEDERRGGGGENHWTGAEAIEWYKGRFTHDTMHGEGDYRWRYLGPEGAFITYEGRFYANCMHGYGAMSYPDGLVFNGLFYKNVRWGPGVEHQPSLRENVGLWSGKRLIRLTWHPSAPSVAPDFITGPNGQAFVEQYRIMLSRTTKVVGETNSALELLKQCGADPRLAAERWMKLYPKHCTDMESKLCHADVFDHDYYKGKIYSLDEVSEVPQMKEAADVYSADLRDEENVEQNMTYFAWNNNKNMIQLMKYCYKHEYQRVTNRTNLAKILNGPRKRFRPSGKHERDSRTLLMASYLGHITNVAQLVNGHNVHPDVADMQGNTALMYATCGEQDRIIHFLVEAGANVNSCNDSCCTPLGVALMRYLCALREIAPGALIQAFLPAVETKTPAPLSLPEENRVQDWYINRDIPVPVSTIIPKNLSKTGRVGSAKRFKSLMTLNDPGISTIKKKTDIVPIKQVADTEYDSDESFSEEKRLFSTINQEYIIRVNNIYLAPNGTVPQYLFTVNNMVLDVANQEMNRQIATKTEKNGKNPKKTVSRMLKATMKPSKEAMWQGNENKIEYASIDSFEKHKLEWLSKIMLTILQLLSDGADPQLVRCPQPALFIAVVAGNAELVHHLVNYGADVNETYPGALHYSALDVAISRPYTNENLEIIRALLEVGADTNHRLKYDENTTASLEPKNPILFPADENSIPGPTLLHAVLARQTDFEFEDDIRNKILELLLDHNCSPITQFNGHSAIDTAMTLNIELLDIFVPRANAHLNNIINSDNQTILVKMFSTQFFKSTSSAGLDRFPILTNLLLYGADPLQKCQDGEHKYNNLFEFAKMTFNKDIDRYTLSAVVGEKTKLDPAKTKGDKLKSEKSKATSTKFVGKMGMDLVSDYKAAVELIRECARLLHIRWLQGKLITELIEVIRKFKHRPWNMILKEHKKHKSVGLWLTPPRCLEIWDMLKTTKQKLYKDEIILKHLLCIVQFFNQRIGIMSTYVKKKMTATEKNIIDTSLGALLKDYKFGQNVSPEAEIWMKMYVKPELETKADEKYNVCFECALPLDSKIECISCKMVSFCSSECMRVNIDRFGCHPCSDFLKAKYFSSPAVSEDSTV